MQPDTAGKRLQEPDVRDWRGEFNVTHPFAADLRHSDFNTALFAHDALVFHALVLAAQAFIILDRTEDARAKQTVAFGLERAVVNCFGRSEEHTSELQSLMRISYAVFCLKKKKNIT